MNNNISETDEIKLYYTICSISRICKKYFFDRKNIPSSCWSINDYVEKILSASKKLETQYNESIQKNK